jgi:MinD-like ATPase involved in chromosome partitioning or flagellar assembly
VDLPTYTNIWRIEKRLYKLYDLRLPMPLPLVQIGVFVGIFVPWIILLQIAQVPFHAAGVTAYVVPPGVLTWLATRPVIEGKRLTELMISQIRYLTEAKTWARLTPIREPDEVAIVGRVWLRRRGVSSRVHAGRARKSSRQAQPAVAPATQADQSAPPLRGSEVPVRPAARAAAQPARASEAPSRRAAVPPPTPAPARAQQRPSLRPTPHEGTPTVSPSSAGVPGRRPGERWGAARPGSGDPWATRVDDPRVTRTDHPPVQPSDDPNATRVDSDDPQVTRAESDDPRATRPEAIRRDPLPPAPQRVRGFPAPIPPPAVPSSETDDGTDQPERPAARASEAERAGGGPASSGTPHRPVRQRSTSHEPERPAISTGLPPRATPFGTPPASAQTGTPPAPGRSGESSEPSRSGTSAQPGHSGERSDLGRSDAPSRAGRPGEPATPTPPAQPGERPDLGRSGTPAAPAGSTESSAPGQPGTSVPPGQPGDRPDVGRSGEPAGPVRSSESSVPGQPSTPASPGQPGERAELGRSGESSGSAPADASATRPGEPGSSPSSPPGGPAGRHEASSRRSPGSDAEGEQGSRPSDDNVPTEVEPTDEDTPTAPVIRLVPGGRHAKPGGRGPTAHEPPAAPGRDREESRSPAGPVKPGTGHDRDESRTAAGPVKPGAGQDREELRSASEGDAGTPSDEDAIASARTDQIVWPARGPREAAPRDTDEAQEASSPKASPQGPPPGPFARPGGQVRGRSHGEAPAPRETRPPTPHPSAPRPPVRKPGQEPAAQEPPQQPIQNPAAGPGQRPEPPQPSAPPQAPRLTTPPQAPLPPAAATSPPAAPVRPGTPPTRPGAPRGWDQSAAPAESPARGVRSGPASPVRPGPLPQANDQDDRDDDGRGLRRIFSGGGSGEGDYEQRVRTAFDGARRVVVLGCTGGAGQTVTGLMLGHTFAQHRRDRIVAVDVNPGPGAMARRTRTETRETLTSLITHAEQVTGYQMMRRYTSVSKSGLEVVAAGKNPVQALDDRDYALAMRTLDRFYAVTLLDAAAAVVARVLPYADQIVLVAPASSDAPRAVAMTFEWLDGHGYEELRTKAVTVINGVSRRSMEDVEQAESVARGRCRALVRIPWDDHLSLDRAPRNELRTLRSSTRKAYIALGGVVAGGLVQVPDRYAQQEFSR